MDKSIPLFMSLGGDGNTRFDFLFKQTNTQAIGNQVQLIGSPNKPGSLQTVRSLLIFSLQLLSHFSSRVLLFSLAAQFPHDLGSNNLASCLQALSVLAHPTNQIHCSANNAMCLLCARMHLAPGLRGNKAGLVTTMESSSLSGLL